MDVGHQSFSDASLHSRRTEASTVPLRKPENSQTGINVSRQSRVFIRSKYYHVTVLCHTADQATLVQPCSDKSAECDSYIQKESMNHGGRKNYIRKASTLKTLDIRVDYRYMPTTEAEDRYCKYGTRKEKWQTLQYSWYSAAIPLKRRKWLLFSIEKERTFVNFFCRNHLT